MPSRWEQKDLEELIRNGIEESLTLEYKSSGSLGKVESKKREITKDVSAMANSAGGTIIFGISQYLELPRQHLPQKLDPINRMEYQKEWLEHVTSNIRPTIEGLVIHPVALNTGSDHVAYVVEVPQGLTAHQALDFRYYKRHNFESVPMADYEIRDVMARRQHPRIQVDFHLTHRQDGLLDLVVFYRNTGNIYAEYVNGFVSVPDSILDEEYSEEYRLRTIEGVAYRVLEFANIHRDVVQVRPGLPSLPGMAEEIPPQPYYVTRYDPVLPGLGRQFVAGLRISQADLQNQANSLVLWVVFADNAPRQSGQVRIGDIATLDDRDEL